MFRKEKKMKFGMIIQIFEKKKWRVYLELVGIGRKDYHYQFSLSQS
jgi:hypothetical protein